MQYRNDLEHNDVRLEIPFFGQTVEESCKYFDAIANWRRIVFKKGKLCIIKIKKKTFIKSVSFI